MWPVIFVESDEWYVRAAYPVSAVLVEHRFQVPWGWPGCSVLLVVVVVRAVPGREQAADPGDSGQSEPGKAERVCHVRF
jgi:hypothetical protein